MKNTVFSAADILLPAYDCRDEKFEKWAVIACDQFTSQLEYWSEAEAFVGDAASTLSLILPEAYLETEKEAAHKARIDAAMKTLPETLKCYPDTFVYLERTLPDGKLRRGVIGKVDLEAYDFSPDSKSNIRATEATVLERIPPRVAVRREATVELPHVMIFCDDREDKVFSYLTNNKGNFPVLYDFPLMQGGGKVTGYAVKASQLEALIGEYEENNAHKLMYAMGDGNHSLASAKALYEEIKAKIGSEAAQNHPARYALAEIVNLGEEAIAFEPIYRLLKNVDAESFMAKLPAEGKAVKAYWASGEKTIYFPETNALTIGSMQDYIDDYIKENPQVVCDYIHGEGDCIALGKTENCLAMICGGIEKEELFDYVEKYGCLPRKTFSMGEARSKRYYLEARKIQ
ncbi:MAG: DUF1015 domain-containing protein [Oscillospiraceae bacterium]|nr:DUF1015 domain-containing protein [Oscillospiraceae bacterium]